MSNDQQAASAAAVRILREIVDYQRRLRRLSVHESSGEQSYLIEAYRRAIKLRQHCSTICRSRAKQHRIRGAATDARRRLSHAASRCRKQPSPRPAGLLRRLGAMLYDAMIVLALWLLTLFIGVALHNGAVVGPLVRTILFVELFSFFAYFWVSRGQTIGMLAWDLHVETNDGTADATGAGVAALHRRDVVLAALGIGYLWIYVDPDRRAWPDMLSGTNVVHRPRA